MTSRADDFDVRYDDVKHGRRGGTGGNGAMPGNVDYELGYDENGWDTQGFRKPAGGHRDAGGYPDELYRPRQAAPTMGPDSMGPDVIGPEIIGTGTTGTRQLQRELGAPRRSHRHSPGGPGGPGGPGRPAGPRGPRGPRGRGRDKVKIKGSWWRHWTLRKALGLFLSLIGGLIILLAVAVVYIYQKTPVPTEQMAAATTSESTVYANDGKTVIGRLGTTNRQTLNYNQFPPQIIYSVLAAEDRGFFTEGGVSTTGIMRAAYSDLFGSGNSLQGGSTITQQFVRNYYQGIGTAQTASRKIKEIFVAMKIARGKSKQWILENYLNTIYLGQSSYGVGAAVQTYFGIPVSKISKVTWSQAALLAAIIQQPSTYPLPEFQTQLMARWHYVVDGLVKMGQITQQQANAMKFPKFGDYIPQAYGNDVWDPYVMNVVQQELEGVYHLSQTQIFNGGYKIVTTVDPAKMAALYQSVNQAETQINNTAFPMHSYMHVGAVLEDPGTGAIQAWYGGPGYAGEKYNGVGRVISASLCGKIFCQDDMGIYNREQPGSSFKPYDLSAAVAQGMNVQTSMLDGQDFVCIPPDSLAFKNTPPVPQGAGGSCSLGAPMANDSTGENGAYNPQDAMTYSVNTAYADLWHYEGGASVAHMAAMFGVDTKTSLIDANEHASGTAIGLNSLTVLEQATMLATIDNGGTYHSAHVIASLSQGGAAYPLRITTRPVFSGDPMTNQNMDSQVQYAMSQVTVKGTGTNAAMSDGRPIIAKTGTTDFAQSAFFLGGIRQQALAVAMFTNHQGLKNDYQTLNDLGGMGQGFGGTWPAMIWHSYAENMFSSLPVLPFPTPVFTGDPWKLAPNSLLTPKKKPSKKHNNGHNPNQGNGHGVVPAPTATCPPGQVTVACNPVLGIPTNNNTGTGTGTGTPTPGIGNGFNISTPTVTGSQAGAAAFGMFGALPVTLLWVRRRRKRTVR